MMVEKIKAWDTSALLRQFPAFSSHAAQSISQQKPAE